MGESKVNSGSASRQLSGKVDLFVAEYLKDSNATQAAIRAGYSAKTAKQQGSRLLTNVDVRQAIDAAHQILIAKIQADTGITLERTLREIARIAYFDPRRLFSKEGRPLSVTELDDETAAVVAGLDVLEEYGEDREIVGHVKKWKLADKRAALDMLMKHQGGYAKDNEQTVTVKEEAASPNEAARRIAYMLQRGIAANDPKVPPRQAAS